MADQLKNICRVLKKIRTVFHKDRKLADTYATLIGSNQPGKEVTDLQRKLLISLQVIERIEEGLLRRLGDVDKVERPKEVEDAYHEAIHRLELDQRQQLVDFKLLERALRRLQKDPSAEAEVEVRERSLEQELLSELRLLDDLIHGRSRAA